MDDFLKKNCLQYAGAISFYTLFSLFPLSLAIISITGFVLGPSTDQTQLAQKISEVVPVSAEFIGQTLQGMVNARAITGVAGVFGLLWAATAAFGSIRKGINTAWGITRTRHFLSERLIDFGLVLGAGLLMMVVLFTTPLLGLLKTVTEYFVPDEAQIAREFIWHLAAQLTSLLLTVLTFLVLYRYLPNTRVRFSDVWVGALVAAVAFEGAKWGFVWYVRTFSVYNLVYGSVGAVMAVMISNMGNTLVLVEGLEFLEWRTPLQRGVRALAVVEADPALDGKLSCQGLAERPGVEAFLVQSTM